MENRTFSVPNISCGHCVRTIENELSELEGVSRVTGSAERKETSAVWEPPATKMDIIKKPAEIGYPARG